ncbi:MAG: hypothetical protein M3R24_12135 [Chloroflexota bacterium]|nr:hypothetical protein [Chloroflexota bacterium]
MDREELIQQTQALIDRMQANKNDLAAFAEACEFLRVYGGPDNEFLRSLKAREFKTNLEYLPAHATGVLTSFLAHVKAGLHREISPERQAQLDVVSDFLEMAQRLLDNKDVHPASAATLIGATLEEFLRTWVENQHLSLDGRKPGLEAYSQVLREANLITKQDGKDITSWAGIRNHAAHGEWDEVGDRARIRIMLEGVNLFMRRYGGR